MKGNITVKLVIKPPLLRSEKILNGDWLFHMRVPSGN